MRAQEAEPVLWGRDEVTSPGLARAVPVVSARSIPYLLDGNCLQNLNLYLPQTLETAALVGTPVTALPKPNARRLFPTYYVHLHGGAWRDPQITSASIEPTVAHAFSDLSCPIDAIASINYRTSQFPTHPTLPYDTTEDHHSDPAREATHPQHLSDVLHAFALLRSFGLNDRSYILSGHSCGACLAFQAILQPPAYYGLENVLDAPCPAAMLGLNGLYDLPALVHELGASHEHLRDEYHMLLKYAFGAAENEWATASPARFYGSEVAQRIRQGRAPQLVVLDQSTEDQLVPMNQKQRLEENLRKVDGVKVVAGHRCNGKHAAPWEQGSMIWDNLRDIASMLQKQ